MVGTLTARDDAGAGGGGGGDLQRRRSGPALEALLKVDALLSNVSAETKARGEQELGGRRAAAGGGRRGG